jgi:hypothetical protein
MSDERLRPVAGVQDDFTGPLTKLNTGLGGWYVGRDDSDTLFRLRGNRGNQRCGVDTIEVFTIGKG